MKYESLIKAFNRNGELTPFFNWIQQGGRFNMDAQIYHDKFLNPQLSMMPGNYNSKSARLIMLLTLAIESHFGLYNRQIQSGIAKGPYQVEDATTFSVLKECDALMTKPNWDDLNKHAITGDPVLDNELSAAYNLRIARYVYGMVPEPLPEVTGSPAIDLVSFFDYYKEHYNTAGGATEFEEFEAAALKYKIFDVVL